MNEDTRWKFERDKNRVIVDGKRRNLCPKCGEAGHNSRTCGVVKPPSHCECGAEKHEKAQRCMPCAARIRAELRKLHPVTRVVCCSTCGQQGHTKRRCPITHEPQVCTACGADRPGRPIGLCGKCKRALLPPRPAKECAVCGGSFAPRRNRQKVCSQECRRRAISKWQSDQYERLVDSVFGRWTVVAHPKSERCAVRCVCGFEDVVSVQTAKNGHGCGRCQRDARHLERAELRRSEFARIAAKAVDRRPQSVRVSRGSRPETKRAVVERMKEAPCMDCGGTYPPICMDFDHRPGEKKVADVSKLRRSATVDAILAEIAKCDLVCSNCHRIRTYARQKPNGRLLEHTAPVGVADNNLDT